MYLKNNFGKAHLVMLAFFAISCLEPYDPPSVQDEIDILVVDGFINSSDGSVEVRLSNTRKLSSDGEVLTETNAVVRVQEEGAGSYSLLEETAGFYTLQNINVNKDKKYRLTIQTNDGQEYASDFIDLRESPPIDSISFEYEEEGVNVFVNAHDGTGQTRYYYWNFSETWEYKTPYASPFKLVNNEPVLLEPAEMVNKCWQTTPSLKISIGSSERLAEDIIKRYPLSFLPRGSGKISIKYSIQVKQRALSKEEFNFWQELQKTTESLGGLFDPQPYQVTGNIRHLNNPAIPVLGYFGGGSVQEKRVYLLHSDLPENLRVLPRSGCVVDTICIFKDPRGTETCTTDLMGLSDTEFLIEALYEGPSLVGYTRAPPSCADCRFQGGSLTMPDFWE